MNNFSLCLLLSLSSFLSVANTQGLCEQGTSTLCELSNGTQACCPVVDATCCSSGDFCCPKGERIEAIGGSFSWLLSFGFSCSLRIPMRPGWESMCQKRFVHSILFENEIGANQEPGWHHHVCSELRCL